MVKNHARSVHVRKAGGKYTTSLRRSDVHSSLAYDGFQLAPVRQSRDLVFSGTLWHTFAVLDVGWMEYVRVDMQLTAGTLCRGPRQSLLIDPAFHVTFPFAFPGSGGAHMTRPTEAQIHAILRGIWDEPFIEHRLFDIGEGYASGRAFHLSLDQEGRSRSGRRVLSDAACARLRRRVDAALIEQSDLAAEMWWKKASRRIELKAQSKQSIPPKGRDAEDVTSALVTMRSGKSLAGAK
jgi:hypothetical protein